MCLWFACLFSFDCVALFVILWFVIFDEFFGVGVWSAVIGWAHVPAIFEFVWVLLCLVALWFVLKCLHFVVIVLMFGLMLVCLYV